MDILLPSEEAMRKMAEEYARTLPHADALSHVLSADGAEEKAACAETAPLPRVLLLLYFAFALGYNSGYGNALADADGNMGRIQSRQRRDGDFDHFFPRKG